MPTWIPGSLAVRLAAFCVGEFLDWGIPALNSLITAIVLYVVLAFAGLMRATGSAEMETAPASADPPAEPEPVH